MLQYDPTLRGLKRVIDSTNIINILLQYDPTLRGLKLLHPRQNLDRSFVTI